MIIFYDAKEGTILYTVEGDELPPVLDGPWLKVDHDPGDISRLCVQDGRLVPHPDAPQRERHALQTARREAFAAEADPMVGRVLRGEIDLKVYRAKVAEIRARFPYEEPV